MDGTSAGELVASKPVPGKVVMLTKWLSKFVNAEVPVRFRIARTEPTRKDVERNRKAAALLADLEPLYRLCAAVGSESGDGLGKGAERGAQGADATRVHRLPAGVSALGAGAASAQAPRARVLAGAARRRS